MDGSLDFTGGNVISIKEVEIIISRKIEEKILGNIITSLESVTKIHDQDMENITNSLNAIKSKLTGRFLQIDNMGCQVSKRGIQKTDKFWAKNKHTQRKKSEGEKCSTYLCFF